MKLIRYDFSGYRRLPVPPELERIRPQGGGRKFYALHPDEGGLWEPASVLEEVLLTDLLGQGQVWAANALAADDAVCAAARGGEELAAAVERYEASLVEVRSAEDVPRYTWTRQVYCPCGCGKVLFVARDVVTEIIFIPHVQEGGPCPMCGEQLYGGYCPRCCQDFSAQVKCGWVFPPTR